MAAHQPPPMQELPTKRPKLDTSAATDPLLLARVAAAAAAATAAPAAAIARSLSDTKATSPKSRSVDARGSLTGGEEIGGALDRLFAVQGELTRVKDPFEYTNMFCNREEQKALKHEYEKLLCLRVSSSTTAEDVALRLEMIKEWETHHLAKHCSANSWNHLGDQADSSKEYRKALVRYHLAANLGSVDAMLALGYAYSNGLGTERNLVERYRWYRMAAEQQSCIAMRSMGITFREGLGFPVDHKLAAEWFQKGVNAGDIDSMYLLGEAYHEGLGVPKDCGHAIALWTQAADDPNAPDEDAADKLAQSYFEGGIVEKDLPKALKYAGIADRFWKPRSTLILGEIAAQEGRPTYAFAKFREAACCRRKDERPDRAIYLTGLAYLKGIGTDSDERKALRYWRQVPDLAKAKNGEAFAQLEKKFQPNQSAVVQSDNGDAKKGNDKGDDDCSELSDDDDDDDDDRQHGGGGGGEGLGTDDYDQDEPFKEDGTDEDQEGGDEDQEGGGGDG